MIGDFAHVIDPEEAVLGLFVTLAEPLCDANCWKRAEHEQGWKT
ncbi:MAG TPA: hypothetical protein VN696_09335 [Pyrinomonadaceae bacterium]|nr:hypothetical protein [Pyrinomonadaceae bacterium]